MKLVGALLCVLLTGVAVVGCGGDEGSDTSSVTKAEFVKQASAICKQTAAKRDAAALALFKEQRKRGAPTKNEVREQSEEVLLEAVLPALSQMTDELEGLERPAEGGDQVDEIIEAYRAAIDKAEGEPAKILAGKANPLVEPRKLAVAYGAKGCSQV